MTRKNVGQYKVGAKCKVKGLSGAWRIDSFPSRRMAVVKREPLASGEPSEAKVSLYDITLLQEGK